MLTQRLAVGSPDGRREKILLLRFKFSPYCFRTNEVKPTWRTLSCISALDDNFEHAV